MPGYPLDAQHRLLGQPNMQHAINTRDRLERDAPVMAPPPTTALLPAAKALRPSILAGAGLARAPTCHPALC